MVTVGVHGRSSPVGWGHADPTGVALAWASVAGGATAPEPARPRARSPAPPLDIARHRDRRPNEAEARRSRARCTPCSAGATHRQRASGASVAHWHVPTALRTLPACNDRRRADATRRVRAGAVAGARAAM